MTAAALASLELPEVLDLKAAGPLHAQLLALRGGDVRLDASRVKRLGGLCLQVLLSARATWRVDGRRLELSEPTTEFSESWSLFAAPSFDVEPLSQE